MPCSKCGNEKVYAKGLCARCYRNDWARKDRELKIKMEAESGNESFDDWNSRTKHKVTKGKRDLQAEFDEKNKDKINDAVRIMKDEGGSIYEVMRQTGLGQGVARRIRKTRVEKVNHPF